MKPADNARTFLELSRIGRNFVPGRASSLADWQNAEKAFQRKVPLAWIEFVEVFGSGKIWLRPLHGEEWHAAPAVTFTYLVAYKDSNYWPNSFDSDIYEAGACRCEIVNYYYCDESGSTTHPDGIGNLEDWIEIGSAMSGDSLHIRTSVRSDEPEALRPSEGEVAWYDHEVGRFVFWWPSVQAFLQCMEDWNNRAVRQPTKEEESAAREIALRELLRQMGANKPVRRVMKHVTGAVSCTHCNSTFFPDDKNKWDGERCLSCGGPLIID